MSKILYKIPAEIRELSVRASRRPQAWATLRARSRLVWGMSVLCGALFSNKDSFAQNSSHFRALSLTFLFACGTAAWRGPRRFARRSSMDDKGKFLDAKGDSPTFNVKPDGTVDWYTYSGFAATIPNARLPRSRWRRLHLCAGSQGIGETYELCGIVWGCCWR